MARRKKSINQIWDQYNRIKFGGGSQARVKKAYDIASRYGKNMQSSERWSEAFRKGMQDYMTRNASESYKSDFPQNVKTAGYGRADNTKFTREEYMGQAKTNALANTIG